PGHGADHRDRLVEDLQRTGAQHRARRSDRVEVERDVEVLGREDRGRASARRPELQLVTVADAAGELEELPQRDAERRLVLTGPGDVAREREEAVSLALLGPHRGEPVLTGPDDAWHR